MNQTILSIFEKNPLLKIFTSVLTHFIWEKIDFDIFNYLDDSQDSEHFLKNSIFEKLFKCFDPLCMRKNRLNWFWNFQFSGWLRRFWAICEKFYLWKFTSVLTHFVGEEFNLRLLIFWINQNILRFFWKILILEKLLSVLTHFVWELFF